MEEKSNYSQNNYVKLCKDVEKIDIFREIVDRRNPPLLAYEINHALSRKLKKVYR